MFLFLMALILSSFCCFLYFITAAFLPVGGGRLARFAKRVNRKKHANMSGSGLVLGADAAENGYMADFGRSVSDAALRAKRAARYNAGDGIFGALKKGIAKVVYLSDERRDVVENKLKRAGYKVKPEEFYADVIARVLGVCLLIPVFALLDVKVAAAGTVILGIGLYYKWIGEPDERIRLVTSAITDELPRFISVLNYSMSTDRDLTRAIERYLKIAKPAFRNDLELLLLEMRGGNIAEALKKFDLRIGIPQLSAFVSGLIDAGRGVDQKTFFFLMEENMKQLFIENKKRELATRPAKVKKAIICVGLCMFLIYLVPICVQLSEGLTMFK